MVLGIDFDNTIVRYDDLFHRVAVERGWVPASLRPRKNEIRDFLRRQGREDDWTALQGYIYGPRMAEALPFPGVREFFGHARRQGIPVYIISHKTRTPAVGPAYDLHQAARDWLTLQGFFDPARIGLPPDHVFFGGTRPEKIRHICDTGCTHFVDDLEETFLEDSFPAGVQKVLFGHEETPADLPGVKAVNDWSHLFRYVFPEDR